MGPESTGGIQESEKSARVLCELVNLNRLLGKACNHYCWLTDCVCGISDHCLVREI